MDNSSNTTAGGMKCCQSLSVQLNPDQLCCRCKAMRAGLCLAGEQQAEGRALQGLSFHAAQLWELLQKPELV